MEQVRFLLTGDTSLSVEFGNEIKESINHDIRAYKIALEKAEIPGIVETVPTYRSLMVHYNPRIIRNGELREKLEKLLSEMGDIEIPPSPVLEIPVLYGGEMGPDLPFVAENAGLSEEEVIRIHSGTEYLIYMLGFTPGFTYLGGMSDKIATPRLQQPRVKIPAGSVGIAGSQTGIYPIDSPGGWQLIGRTPLKMYDPNRETPILPEAGQYMKFYPIDQAEYDRILKEVEEGRYQLKTHERKEA
ncbi:MAG: 5-oxoprolinase subunit PxpB [Lachnospiraceae bacterium]|nr:5-oxoprolinase subunit PxpB [Lachnospiraceae bacterium]